MTAPIEMNVLVVDDEPLMRFHLQKSLNELWEDAPALEANFRRLYGLESAHRIEQEIVDGKGTRGPLGILNGECLITVAAESGQTAATVTAGNLLAMWSRMWEPSRKRAVWIVNGDVEEQLGQAKLATGTALDVVFSPCIPALIRGTSVSSTSGSRTYFPRGSRRQLQLLELSQGLMLGG